MRSTTRIAILTLALCALSGGVLAQPRGQGHGRRGPADPERMLGRLTQTLDLTEEQQGQIESLIAQHREATSVDRERVPEFRQQLQDQLHADLFDEQAIRETADELHALQTDLMVARAGLMRDVREVLTPEQRETLGEMRGRRHERMEQRFQDGTGSGKGGRRGTGW